MKKKAANILPQNLHPSFYLKKDRNTKLNSYSIKSTVNFKHLKK
jgi:hypothetical protein